MSNVVGFDEFESEHQIDAHQVGLPRIVLEGQTDVHLFEDWFRHLLDVIQFVEASDVVRGGGCSSVEVAVLHSRETDDIPAIGIVDRDTLFRSKVWELLYTCDDAEFAAAQSPDVVRASLWEVEAYLLRPDLLAEWVALRRDQLPAPPELCAGALEAAIEEAEALLGMAPTLAALHADGQSCPSTWGNHFPAGKFEEESAAAFDDARQREADVVAAVEALVNRIHEQAPTDSASRLLYMLRYVDTKRLLARLSHRLGMRGKSHLALGLLMSREAYSPPELQEIVAAYAERWAA